MNILLTGFTGNLAPGIAAALTPHRIFALVRDPAALPDTAPVEPVKGTLANLPAALAPEIDAIVHCAALTNFRGSAADLRTANVAGVESLVRFARRCPRLQRFIHFSTTCICGLTGGLIPEAPNDHRPIFVNGYEETKWEAEQVILASSLPAEIFRLCTVAGSETDGAIRRAGALHYTLLWLYKGLIPVMPGREDSRVDIVSTEFAAAAFSALWTATPHPGRIIHATAGDHAPLLTDLLQFLRTLFAQHNPGWARGAIVIPDIVDGETYAQFEDSVRRSGDSLFLRVCESASSFLPGLLHPRTFATSLTAGVPVPDWRAFTEKVFTWQLTHDWGRATSPSHVQARIHHPHAAPRRRIRNPPAALHQ